MDGVLIHNQTDLHWTAKVTGISSKPITNSNVIDWQQNNIFQFVIIKFKKTTTNSTETP
jgi:hypothetical protein